MLRAGYQSLILVILASALAFGCGADSTGESIRANGGAGQGSTSGGVDGGGSGPSGSGGSMAGSGAPTGGVGGVIGPASCAEAAGPYTVGAAPLGAGPRPASAVSGWGSELFARFCVAVDPASNEPYVGFTSADGAAVIAGLGGVVTSIPNATHGGIAVTNNGIAALVFDPNTDVEARVWAAVKRFAWDGSELFSTDLFRSSNLDDVGTKGAPGTSRFGYLPSADELVAYFGHTQRYDDGVRHQGGYLATVDANGTQHLLDGWFGSHNLDQRLLVSDATAAVLGLGDAYPKGIFFSFIDDPETNVIYPLAGNGNGDANGQLGGMVDLGDEIIVPFITNRSVPQELDAGTWPNLDQTVVDEIRAAASNGTDLGLLRVPKVPNPGQLSPIWLDPQLASGARLERLKSARYGTGALVLLGWAEAAGSGRTGSINGYYTMVVDREGAVCQPKTPIDASLGFTAGDDIVLRPDGSIVWANAPNDVVQIVTLTPQ
jgi:hypothetical protein